MAASSDSNEIRLTRVYDAPLRAVWDAWTIPEQVEKWWGPRGFSITTHGRELRVGGSWRFTMHGPDGVDFPNVTTYLAVEPYQKLVYDHGATEDQPPLFRVSVTFTEANGKTTMEMISTLPSPEAAREVRKRVEQFGGNTTWDRLAEHLEQHATGKQCFVFTRTFDAPIARVYACWVNPEALARWLPPAGTTLRFLRSDIAPGKSTFFVIEGAHAPLDVRAEYLALEPERRIVYTQQFVDERERLAEGPDAQSWPPTLLTTVLFSAEAPDRTRVTLSCEAHGEATRAELDAFVQERAGMTRGWSGSFDVLAQLLEPRAEAPHSASLGQ